MSGKSEQLGGLQSSIRERHRFFPMRVFSEQRTLPGTRIAYASTSNRILVFHTLPGFVALLSILLTTGFIGLLLSLMMGLHLENMRLHANPLAAYEMVWPGQPLKNVALYARQAPGGNMTCNSEYPGLAVQVSDWETESSGREMICANYPADGVFSLMSLSISGNHVKQLNLVSRDLPEDVLLLYWGIPDAIQEGENGLLFLHWQRSTYLATAMVRQADSIVEHVTLTAK